MARSTSWTSSDTRTKPYSEATPNSATTVLPSDCSSSAAKRWRISALNSRSSFMVSKPGVSKRSEEHTSELQSRFDLVCRLLLEKKKKIVKPLLIDKKKTTIEQK